MAWITPQHPDAKRMVVIVETDAGAARLMDCDGVDPETGEVSLLNHDDSGFVCIDSENDDIASTRVNLGAGRVRVFLDGAEPQPARAVHWHGAQQRLVEWGYPLPKRRSA